MPITATAREHWITYKDWKQSAILFIQKWAGKFSGEWYSETCEFDNKQNSRGHWTSCPTLHVRVTREQADKEFIEFLSKKIKMVDYPHFNDNQKIALLSYVYNTGGYQLNLPYHLRNGNMKDIKYIMSIWGYSKIDPKTKKEIYPWLKFRRAEEKKLFNL